MSDPPHIAVAYIYKNKVVLEMFYREQDAKKWFIEECITKNLIKKPANQIRNMIHMSLEEIVQYSGVFMGIDRGDDELCVEIEKMRV